jgi:hypothetical protein
MFTTCCASRVAFALGLLCLFFPSRSQAQSEGKTVLQKKREVEERKLQLIQAQRKLAQSSADLALAEGNRDREITELTTALDFYQSEAQWLRDHANWFCDPRDLMTENQWEKAKVSARLAKLRGDSRALVAECKKIVGFHEQDLKRVEQLAQVGAIKSEEKSAAAKGLAEARRQLTAAEKHAMEQEKKRPTPLGRPEKGTEDHSNRRTQHDQSGENAPTEGH